MTVNLSKHHNRARIASVLTVLIGLSIGYSWATPLEDSEKSGAEIGARLDELAVQFLKKQGDGGKMGNFSEAVISLSPLRPEGTEPAAIPGGFLFSQNQTLAAPQARKAADLAVELSALRKQLGTREHHIKFKVIDVQRTAADQLRSVQLFAGDGESDSGRREIHARWTTSWKRAADGTLKLTELKVDDYQLAELQEPEPLFRDRTLSVMRNSPAFTEQYALGNNHWRDRIETFNRFFKFGHNGVSIGDVNGDGLEDLYSCQTGGLPNRLFLHQADGSVIEAAAAAGVDFLDSTRAALFADFDNDGDQDLALALNGGVMIMRNDGTGKFEPTVRYPGVTNGFSMAAADFDLDGDLDLFVCRYYAGKRDGARLAVPVPYFDANNGGENFLIRNDGPSAEHPWLTFSDATAETGLNANNTRFSYAAVWEDFDLDGDPDLYVANDFGKNNLYLNESGSFRDITAAAGLEDGAFGMSAATGDLDGDRWPDLYVGNMFSSAGSRVTRQQAFRGGADETLRSTFQRLARGNSVFRALGGSSPKFEDVSLSSGANLGRWSWGSLFFDMNNDGAEDLFVANGFFTGRDPDDL